MAMNGITTISEKEHIYEVEGDNPLLQEIREIANDNVIFRVSQFARVVGDRLVISTFLPSYQTLDFLKTLAKLRLELNRSLRLHGIQPFQPSLFEFI